MHSIMKVLNIIELCIYLHIVNFMLHIFCHNKKQNIGRPLELMARIFSPCRLLVVPVILVQCQIICSLIF